LATDKSTNRLVEGVRERKSWLEIVSNLKKLSTLFSQPKIEEESHGRHAEENFE